MSNITFKQYRNIDLFIFTALLVVSEAITTFATNIWFDRQPIAISTTLTFICLVMMRWNVFAIIPALIGGLVFCIASNASAELYVIYVVGNCMSLLSLLWFKVFKKEDIRKNPFKLFLFVASSYILLQSGRWLVSLFYGGGLRAILGYLGTDIASLLFAALVMFLMKNVDGMIEDQKAFLFRQQREREARAAADQAEPLNFD